MEKFVFIKIIAGVLLIALNLSSAGLANDMDNTANKDFVRFDLNVICFGTARDFVSQKDSAAKFTISAYRENGVATVIIDRIDRDGQSTPRHLSTPSFCQKFS